MNRAYRVTLQLLLLVSSCVAAEDPQEVSESPKEPDKRKTLVAEHMKSLFGNAFPTGEDPAPNVPWRDRLRDDPNDPYAIIAATKQTYERTIKDVDAACLQNHYEGFAEVERKLRPVLLRLEQELLQFEETVNRLPGTTPEARSATRYARHWLLHARRRVLTERTIRTEAKQRVIASPSSRVALEQYFSRLHRDVLLHHEVDPTRTGALLTEASEVLCVVKEHLPGRSGHDGEESLESMVVAYESLLRDYAIDFEATQRVFEAFESRVGATLDLDGVDEWANGQLTKEDYPGRIAVIIVGAVQSRSVAKIIPDLRSLNTNYGQTDLATIAWITYEQPAKDVADFAKQIGLPVTIGFQTPKAHIQFHPAGKDGIQRGRPAVLVADQLGKIRLVREWNNATDNDEITAMIEELLTGGPGK